MTRFDPLLVVQEHDTTLDQLAHRLATLAQRAERRSAESAVKTAIAELATAVAARDAVADREAGLERDIAASEDRISQIDKRMSSGEIAAARDLQAMATEIDHIKARVSTLEDQALEAMDEREPLDEAVATQTAVHDRLLADVARLEAEIAEAETTLAAEIAAEQQVRAEAAATVPAELLAEYERLRARLGGIGVARLEHGTCMGCRMKLPATELDRVRHVDPDALVHCEQCGRILVRPD